MKYEKKIPSHYLSLSYKALINNKIIHSFLFILEIFLVFFQFLEIYYYDFDLSKIKDNSYLNIYTFLLNKIKNLSDHIVGMIYTIVIVIIIINSYILNYYRLNAKTMIKITINISELFFYRLFSSFFFNYLFITKSIYLGINIFLSIIYALTIFFNFYKNHLFLFFPKIIVYPYDYFSMIIDLHLLFIKIFLSISRMIANPEISEFFFVISIFIIYILLFYLTYLMIYKSYYLMNNHSLNKIKYSMILSLCFSLCFILISDKEHKFNIFVLVSQFNIIIVIGILVHHFYNPYQFVKFDKDDNIENAFYYFFILDRNQNDYLLLEDKIEEHLSKCNTCNLCKKYKNIKIKMNEEIDLYQIISNSKNRVLNLLNIILRGIKKNGKKSFQNNSYLLINMIYIYCMAINQKDSNFILNSELLFDIINSENESFLEQYKISLKNIKYTNEYFIKAKNIIEMIYKIFDEKQSSKKIKLFFKLGEELEYFKYKKIKPYLSNSGATSGLTGGNLEIPNCNNLLTICSLFYEELFNETFSNSGISIRDNPNLLEDLINSNIRNSKQITLEINVINFYVKIIRAGGVMNKYENNNFFDFFSPIFKKKQIKEMKRVLFQSNSVDEPIEAINKSKSKYKKGKELKKQYLSFCFIIEEKEENGTFIKLLNLRLGFILLANINNKIYLNGNYNIDNNIIVTEQIKENEIVLSFGNKEQKNFISKHKGNKKICIKHIKNDKFLGNKKLEKVYNYLGCKKYSVYRLLLSNKKKNAKNSQTKIHTLLENDLIDNSNNKIILFNDLASQTSSNKSSFSSNNLITFNKGSKKNENKENITKELSSFKYLIIFSVFLYLIFLIIGYLILYNSFKDLYKAHNFYIFYQDYSGAFYKLFFSVLSLGCLANSTESYNCRHFVDELKDIAISNFFHSLIANNDTDEKTLKSHFIDFKKLLYYQSQILSDDLNILINQFSSHLSQFKNEKFLNMFNANLIHFKLNQKIINDNLVLEPTVEKISFTDFNLLMTSRFSIILNDINNFKQPIYIINKDGNDLSKNIYGKEKLTIYQENIYLLILDYKIYCPNIVLFVNEIINIISISKKKIKNAINLFFSLNVLFFIIIFGLLILYIILYYMIILKNLDQIQNNLKEKIEDITIKELLRKKLDNLKIILNIYDNDINKKIEALNNIYTIYKDNLKQKIKEETKLIKKEGKNNESNKNKSINFIKLLKAIQQYNLMEYSGRRNLYLYSIIFVFLIYLIIFIIILIIWVFFFQKEKKIDEWNTISETANGSTINLMISYLLMIYNNQTIGELAIEMGVYDFIDYVYSNLTPLYELDYYASYLMDLLQVTETNIIYDCSEFYENLNNDVFEKLKKKFEGEKNELIYTMYFFCEWSNAMQFQNFKTIYLQLFNQVKTGMENFKNFKYTDIIEFIDNNQVIKNIIMFMIIYIYIIDIMYGNVKSSILRMTDKTKYNIFATIISFLLMLIFVMIIIFIVYIRNINKDSKKFIRIRKVFKLCKVNE